VPITVQGVNVHLVDRGAGPTVLLLHGVPDSADMWDGVIARLVARFRCLAPDLPGMGRSTAPADFDCSLDGMARFVDGLVAALGIAEPLNLVMTDFGGTYGLAWAVTHPDRVRRLAITGGVSFFPDYPWHRDARMLRTPVVGDLAMAVMRESIFLSSMRKNAPGLSDAHLRKVYALSFAKPSVRRMVLRLYRTTDFRDFAPWEERLHALTARVPTLVLWGDRDPYIAPHYAERFGAQQVEHFPDGGHWLAVESPDLVADRLAAFLA